MVEDISQALSINREWKVCVCIWTLTFVVSPRDVLEEFAKHVTIVGVQSAVRGAHPLTGGVLANFVALW